MPEFGSFLPVRRRVLFGCSVAIALFFVLVVSVSLMGGGLRVQPFQPYGHIRFGGIEVAGSRELSGCASPNIGTCKDSFFLLDLRLRVPQTGASSLRLLRLRLE